MPATTATPETEVDQIQQLRDGCNQHIGRLRKVITTSPEGVMREITETVLPIVRDLSEQLMILRGSAWEGLDEFATGMNEFDERLVAVEEGQLPDSTVLMPEDAESILKLAEGTTALCEAMLAQGGHAPEGEQKIRELMALATTCKTIATDNVIEPEDDDEAEDEGDAQPSGVKPS
jgi:hypothetical protein